MGAVYEGVGGHVREFIEAQHVFFVATADREGLVNLSPKGGAGTLVVLDAHTVAYLDMTGSGVETIAHVQAARRITLMWCAFDGPPNIVRVHGTATVVRPGDSDWERLAFGFPDKVGARSIIVVNAERVSDACGFGVPEMAFVRDREQMDKWVDGKGPAGILDYQAHRNASSLDGLPGITT